MRQKKVTKVVHICWRQSPWNRSISFKSCQAQHWQLFLRVQAALTLFNLFTQMLNSRKQCRFSILVWNDFLLRYLGLIINPKTLIITILNILIQFFFVNINSTKISFSCPIWHAYRFPMKKLTSFPTWHVKYADMSNNR